MDRPQDGKGRYRVIHYDGTLPAGGFEPPHPYGLRILSQGGRHFGAFRHVLGMSLTY